jgi:hypothetical protein
MPQSVYAAAAAAMALQTTEASVQRVEGISFIEKQHINSCSLSLAAVLICTCCCADIEHEFVFGAGGI